MSLKTDIESLADYVPKIKANRNYWFVRTDGGDYYESFVSGKYIAIGYEEIPLFDIFLAKEAGGDKSTKILAERVKELIPKENRPGFVASQIMNFSYSIKKSDIVIIPSKSSDILYFGEVQKTEVYLKETEDDCPFTKRKPIKWLKSVAKRDLEAEFYKMIFVHNTISNAKEYAGYIDRTLSSFFIKGDATHLVLDVRTNEKIPADVFYNFGAAFDLLEDFCEKEKIENEGVISIKTNVQSEGIMEIIQSNAVPIALLAFGLILNALAGGGFSGKIKLNKDGLDAEVKNDIPVGIIERISNSLKSKREDKLKADIVKKCLEEMEILSPEDIVKLIEKAKEKE